jgi:hypothetical protein
VIVIYTDGVETTKFYTVRGPWWAPTPPVGRGCSPPLVTKLLDHPQTAPAHIALHLSRNIYSLPAISLFFSFLLPIKHVVEGVGRTAPAHATKHVGKVKLTPLRAWTGPFGSRKSRLPEFLDNRHIMIWSSAIRTGRLYPQGDITAIGWVAGRAIAPPEGLCQWKPYRWRGGTTPVILKLGTRQTRVVDFTPPAAVPAKGARTN